MWDLSSPTRDQTHVPCIGRWTCIHWTTRKVLPLLPTSPPPTTLGGGKEFWSTHGFRELWRGNISLSSWFSGLQSVNNKIPIFITRPVGGASQGCTQGKEWTRRVWLWLAQALLFPPQMYLSSVTVTCCGRVSLRAEFSFRDPFSNVLDEMMLDEISLLVTGLHPP